MTLFNPCLNSNMSRYICLNEGYGARHIAKPHAVDRFDTKIVRSKPA
jgi:hypothetical protein